MRKILPILLFIIMLSSCATHKNKPAELVGTEKFQHELVEFYTNPSTTPLNEEEIAIFKGITFFPIDEKYNIKADFTPINDGNIIPFPTSAGKVKYYKEYGIANFDLDGKNFALKIYQANPILDQYPTHLFLPFTDETNGDTTYGGGRYIDLDTEKSFTENGKIIINFNEAYNPYCAYSKRYNCPIPPSYNSLDTEIKAGVTYKK